MKRTVVTAFLMLGSLFTLAANEEATYFIPQPLVAFGDTEGWTTTGEPHADEAYMILGMPYFQKYDHGPIYHPIASPRLMANSDSDAGPLRDCNLLSLCGIAITHQPLDSKIVFLDLTHAKAENDSVLTLEVAAYAALECIRMVADRYHSKITLRITAPKDEANKWHEIEIAFNKHDKTKPFKRQNKRQK